MQGNGEPVAYFITFTCRGAWLHGDERGSVDKEHNAPGTPFLSSNPVRLAFEQDQVEPYVLDGPRRTHALQAIRDLATKKGWRLWCAHVRTNHIHTIVSAPGPVERVMNDIKTAISRRLNKHFPEEKDVIRWTRHGSTRYLWKHDQLASALTYVVEGQGEPMAVYDGRVETDPPRK